MLTRAKTANIRVNLNALLQKNGPCAMNAAVARRTRSAGARVRKTAKNLLAIGRLRNVDPDSANVYDLCRKIRNARDRPWHDVARSAKKVATKGVSTVVAKRKLVTPLVAALLFGTHTMSNVKNATAVHELNPNKHPQIYFRLPNVSRRTSNKLTLPSYASPHAPGVAEAMATMTPEQLRPLKKCLLAYDAQYVKAHEIVARVLKTNPKLTAQGDPEGVAPGTHLQRQGVMGQRGIYHHGIYIGMGYTVEVQLVPPQCNSTQVAKAFRDAKQFKTPLGKLTSSLPVLREIKGGGVGLSTLANFVEASRSIGLEAYGVDWKAAGFKPIPRSRTIQWIIEQIGLRPYDILLKNCEHLATMAVLGYEKCAQAEAAFRVMMNMGDRALFLLPAVAAAYVPYKWIRNKVVSSGIYQRYQERQRSTQKKAAFKKKAAQNAVNREQRIASRRSAGIPKGKRQSRKRTT